MKFVGSAKKRNNNANYIKECRCIMRLQSKLAGRGDGGKNICRKE